MCPSTPSDARLLGGGRSYHVYKAKEFRRDCQEAAVTDTFKQQLKAETLYIVYRHQKLLLQSSEFWNYVYLLSVVIVHSFLCLCIVGCSSFCLKSTACNCCRLCCFNGSAYIGSAAPSSHMLAKLIQQKHGQNWQPFRHG